MTYPAMFMSRQEFSSENHVFRGLDEICQNLNIPKFEEFILSVERDPEISNCENSTGLRLSIPVYSTPFLSYFELKMQVHWCHLNYSGDINYPVSELAKHYPAIKTISLVIKTNCLKRLWFQYSISSKSKYSNYSLIEFEQIIKSRRMWRELEKFFAADNDMTLLLRQLTESEISEILDRCVLIEENQIFNLGDQDFFKISQELIWLGT